MGNKNLTKNYWLIGIIVVAAAIFLFTDSARITGAAPGPNGTINANACARDQTCEMRNARVNGNLDVGVNGTFDWVISNFVTSDILEVDELADINGDLFVNGLGFFSTDVSVQGDLDFFDEIQPDGATCAVGQILQKVGADDWDCVTPEGGGGGGTGTLDCETKFSTFTGDGNKSVTCSSGQIVTGGGVFCTVGEVYQTQPNQFSTEETWYGGCTESSGSSGNTVYARCCSII